MTSANDDTLVADPSTSVAVGGKTSAPSDSESPATLKPGSLFAERYEIQVLLGRGGMGAVYRVRDSKLDEVVALKLLTPGREHAEERFVTEVRLARRITHPNVARTHDFGEDGTVRFLTMEYVPGSTLEHIIAEQAPLSTPAIVEIGTQLTAGLAAAHAAGVVHRDLKPANVLVGDDDRVVITDFGIARATSQASATRTGVMLGTPHYMAPEQVLGRTAEARSDLYALGVILYELATGVLPFEGDSVLAIALARVHACPTDPRSHHPVDDSLASLILRCLAREPEGRPASAEALESALRVVLGQEPEPVEPEPVQDAPARPFAPISPGSQSIAVLPFAYRGHADHSYLGDAMAEELVDVLSRTRGLRVLSLGATRRFAQTREPSEIVGALGPDAIVDGTVQHTGGRVRLSVRMIDPDGTQRWSERYDGSLEDVFDLQESLGRRVAEALRIELVAVSPRCDASPDAIEHYLRARRLLRTFPMIAADEALTLLDHAVELAPDLGPALAAHAIASVRAWWGYDDHRRDPAYAERAQRSVTRARKKAPALAETHLATAMWEVQSGGFVAAARALGRALEIAPTMPEAHQYLGQLQCEAGRPKEGRERLELALQLDPSLHLCRYMLARVTLFEGDGPASREHTEILWRSLPGPPLPTMIMRMRLALYRGDMDEARQMRRMMAETGTKSGERMFRLTGLAFGEASIEETTALYTSGYGSMSNGRFTTLIRQVAVELFALAGAPSLALRELTTAADTALIDLVWLQRCSALDPLRAEPAFERAVYAVERRVAAIWR